MVNAVQAKPIKRVRCAHRVRAGSYAVHVLADRQGRRVDRLARQLALLCCRGAGCGRLALCSPAAGIVIRCISPQAACSSTTTPNSRHGPTPGFANTLEGSFLHQSGHAPFVSLRFFRVSTY